MKIFLQIALILGMATTATCATYNIEEPAVWADASEQDELRKEEINPRDLPEEARMDIVDNYHNAKILKSYKLFRDGEFVGYLVEVEKGPKNWTIRYDTTGNPLNKINPIKT